MNRTKIEHPVTRLATTANVYMRLHIHVTILSIHGKFQPVSLHALTLAARPYVLLTILYHHLVDNILLICLLLLSRSSIQKSELLYNLDTLT